MKRKITKSLIEEFKRHLQNEEKSFATIEKYVRDVRAFFLWSKGRELEKSDVILYKKELLQRYKTKSVNSMLSSLNSFFLYLEWYELRVKIIKLQRELFIKKEKELSRSEYLRLLEAAKQKGNSRLYYIMQTICASGIRISELRYITVEAVKNKLADVRCKGKSRTVILPDNLCKLLEEYIRQNKISTGCVFVSKNGNPINRSNIWTDMKKLCESANVESTKVFPHNLRHLFARTFYSQQKDIVRLADLLGHASINTTRIYTMESGDIHRCKIQKMGLVFEFEKIKTT